MNTQLRLNDLVAQYKELTDEMIPSKQLEVQRATLTSEEISTFPATTTMYKAVGKAFLKIDQPTVLSLLDSVKKTSEEDLELYTKKKASFEQLLNNIFQRQQSIKAQLEAQ